MFDAVIPTQNEEKSIMATLTTALRLPLNRIIPVINGCTDRTLELIGSIPDPRLHILYFEKALGIDVPRAVGAKYAQSLGSQGVLFLDGDMSGDIFENLENLLKALEAGTDMALTNCYPYITYRAKLANLVLKFRSRLNRELDLFKTLGLATPTHGPHALSAKALSTLPVDSLAVPPLSLVWAKRAGLDIRVATSIPHEALRSPRKHRRHARLLAETIMGDCAMALNAVRGQPFDRSVGKHPLLGYHPERRFDLLHQWETACREQDAYYHKHLIRFD
ncbi:MAG: glycosyltransferase family 2 protein [Desulfitobacteriaceae bacterium]